MIYEIKEIFFFGTNKRDVRVIIGLSVLHVLKWRCNQIENNSTTTFSCKIIMYKSLYTV